jgi:hypothetical protein
MLDFSEWGLLGMAPLSPLMNYEPWKQRPRAAAKQYRSGHVARGPQRLERERVNGHQCTRRERFQRAALIIATISPVKNTLSAIKAVVSSV